MSRVLTRNEMAKASFAQGSNEVLANALSTANTCLRHAACLACSVAPTDDFVLVHVSRLKCAKKNVNLQGH